MLLPFALRYSKKHRKRSIPSPQDTLSLCCLKVFYLMFCFFTPCFYEASEPCKTQRCALCHPPLDSPKSKFFFFSLLCELSVHPFLCSSVPPLLRSASNQRKMSYTKRLFKLPEPGKRQRGRPFKVKSGLRGRPKTLPSGTVEWFRQSLNNDVFCKANLLCNTNTTDSAEGKVCWGDNLSALFYKMKGITKISNCKSAMHALPYFVRNR